MSMNQDFIWIINDPRPKMCPKTSKKIEFNNEKELKRGGGRQQKK